MQAWELAAREAVRELVARYNLAGDRGRIDELVELFADDAVLSVDGAEHHGPDAIRAVFEGATGPHPQLLRHFTATLSIDVASEERASARCYFQVLTVDGLDHWGRYTDGFVRVGDDWRFARRDVRVDGATPGGWASLRGYGARPQGPHELP